jgi:ubiquinone/menaquinone biosynthesis C-methylase UbiE
MTDNAAKIFNEMKEEYDILQDLWYSWLFSRLHFLIAKNSIVPFQPKKVLDVGCGTGFQSFLFAAIGAEVFGVDIASDLIDEANKKKETFNPSSLQLFPSYFSFVDRYNKKIENTLYDLIKSNQYQPPKFFVGDAQKIEFPDSSFDHVNCCGSTLNFIDDYNSALSEISRVLKPNGTFSIEVDARWNMDIFWPVIDNLLFGALKFEMTFKESFANIFQPIHKHIKIDYPFGESENPVMMNLWLFTKTGMKRDLQKVGLRTENNYSIHSFTNLIPSTFLDSSKPSKLLKRTFNILSKLDEANGLNKFPGCSLVLFGYKQ